MFSDCFRLSSISIGQEFIRDKPFQAQYEVVLENRPSNDGLINDRGICQIMRDGQGRTRKEFLEADKKIISINDPLAKTWYCIDDQAKKVITRNMLMLGNGYHQSVEFYKLVKKAHQENSNMPQNPKEFERLEPKKLEMLVCNGLRLQGMGYDEQGNTISPFFEMWIAQEIEEIVAYAFIETQFGPEIKDLMNISVSKELHTISEIKLGEIDPELFIIPSDYQLIPGGSLIVD